MAALALAAALAGPAHAAEPRSYADARAGQPAVPSRADRAALQRRLGSQAVVDIDRHTGTPRALARLDGTLTGPSSGSAEAIASGYIRANLSVLGLTEADFDALEPAAVTPLPGGVTSVRWRQAVDGVPAADHELRVNVARDGRVLNVLGSPAHALSLKSTAPVLTAGEAVRAVQDDVGLHRPLVRRSGPAGATRRTVYADGTEASLVTFAGRLAWRVRHEAAAEEVYDVTVDARTGDVLRRANMVKFAAPALVWERFPGNLPGGTPATVDFEARGWLTTGATNLNGPNAHAFSDVNDDQVAQASEEVGRVGGSFSFPLVSVGGSGCDAGHLCSWSGGTSTDWQANRAQGTVQSFHFANRFHDHLASLGFDAAAGAFEGADKLELNTFDGAATGPDSSHVNNASMLTPPNGVSPQMQMFLLRNPNYRNANTGDDAAILYHEYVHGLSNRLVTDPDGIGALYSPEAGAMGEGWSDWYAQDFIVGQFPSLDTPASGEVDMGEYWQYTGGGSRLRTQPMDCPAIGADPIRCPGRPVLGAGGYTYGDFGRIGLGPQVHSDGEIWSQALWDLRAAVGIAKARGLVTVGMVLTPPEPSFLDARNGILLADQALYGGADLAALWAVFAGRGMGFFAAATGGEDLAPAENFSPPPPADGPKGTIAGRVTDALTGASVAGVNVGVAGLGGLAATTSADGSYTIPNVPEGTYLKVMAIGPGYDSAVSSLSVSGGFTINFSPALQRNWASIYGGAVVTATNGAEYDGSSCGPLAAVDQWQATGWSTNNGTDKFMVVRLPSAVTVTQFALDPGEACGDGATSATAAYRVETSPDGVAWTVAHAGTFGSAARHQLNLVTPTAGTTGVRYARLWLLSAQGGPGAPFRDFTEFGVYGTSTGSDTTPPDTILEPGGPPVFTFSSSETGSSFECRLDSAAFAPCTSPHNVGALADGTYTFAVRARDTAGNVDPTPATRTFTVDTTGPDTTLAAGGPPQFTFSSPESGVTFECKLDGPGTATGTYAACTSPRNVGTLADGTYTFTVRARDGVGNVDPSPASRTFTIDTQAPDTSITAGPSGPVTGNTHAFSFSSSETGSTFECRLGTAAFGPCTSPHSVGPLADGTYTFSVRARDGAGNLDGSPATRTFTVDSVAPETTITDGPIGATNNPSPQFAFSSSETGSTLECRVGTGAFAPCTSPLTLGPLADGTYTLFVRATDAAGNLDTSPAMRLFVVDTAAPETTLNAGGPPSFAFVSSEGGSTFECRLGSAEFAPCTSPHNVGALADGTYTFSVRARDLAGNVDQTPATRTFTIDTVAPETTINSGPTGTISVVSTQFGFASEVGATFECRLDGPGTVTGTFATCVSPVPVGPLADGTYTLLVRARDGAGNVDPTPATRSFAVDTTAPDTTIDTGPSGVTGNNAPVFTFSATEAGSTFECRLDTGAFEPCTSPRNLGTLADGAHTLSVRATDALGNTDPTPASRTFTIDTETPDTTIESGPTGTINLTTPQFTFSASEPGSTFECRLDTGAFESCTSPRTLGPLVDGLHAFSVRAIDGAGNVDPTPASRTFTVETTTPDTAVLTGPSGPTNQPSPAFTFSSTKPNSTFECRLGTAAFQTCTSPHPVGPLADGTHTFAVRARDAGGNLDDTPATRTFTVDTAAPQTTLDAGGPPVFTFASSEAGSSFECRLGSAEFAPCTSPHNVGALADGTYTFSVRARDTAGNVDPTPATRTFTVDTVAPNTTITAGPPEFAFISSEPNSTFECKLDSGPFETCTSPRTLGALADGQHQFSVRAIDAAGNVDQTPAALSFTIDTTAPQTTLDPGGPPQFTFFSSEPGSTFECRLDDGLFLPCTSPHDLGTLADGSYTFSVRARDAAGNVDATPATRDFTIDTVAPNTAIDSGPTGTVNIVSPQFAFSSTEAGSTFECRLGTTGTFEPCTSPRSVGPLADGDYTFAVRARDAAGNVDQTPATRSFAVNTTAPQTAIESGPPPFGSDPTPTFVLTSSTPNSTFACSLDDAPFTPCVSPFTTQPLQDGPHTFAARATDPIGNADPTPATFAFTVDTAPPDTVIDTGPPPAVHAGPLTFTMHATEEATIECALDAGAFGSCATIGRAEDLATGEHVYRARATDRAGNLDPSPDEWRFTVTNAAPVAALELEQTGPLTVRATPAASDPDGDPLTYVLDFGDGQTTQGSLPVAAIEHRYDATGVYTARLEVRDARVTSTQTRTVTVTQLQATTPPALGLQLSAPAGFGSFTPGVSRDYTTTVAATITGTGTLRVADQSPTATGHLTGGGSALPQALHARGPKNAFEPLTSPLTLTGVTDGVTTIEFKQPIAATDALRTGAYAKTLTFTLAPAGP